jgi:hypothetical protein
MFRTLMGRTIVIPPMPTVTKSTSEFDREDVTFVWSGGRNITWRLTHGPTGISVEGSTQLTETNFTKKLLRVADRQLMEKLLHDLEKLIVQHERSAVGAG